MTPTGNYVAGKGPSDAKLMFVGEAPGAVEDYTGVPFAGPTGDLFNEILRELGYDRRSAYVTNVIKYRPPANKLSRLEEIGVSIDQSIDQLWHEINAINPNVIVPLGNLSLKAICGKGDGFKGIMKWRGSLMKSVNMDFKCIPTLHPAALLHAGGELQDESKAGKYGKKKGALKYSYRHILKLDLSRAIKESQSKLYEPSARVNDIAKDSVSLQRFLDLYSDRSKYPYVSVDIEVVKSIPFCIALAFNSWHAISVPLLDIYSWQNEEGIVDHQLAEMWRMVALLLDSDVGVIGQNFKFDRGQLLRLCCMRVRNFHCDTSLLAHALHPEFPKSLEFLTSIYTKQPYYKDEGREFNWKKDKISRVLHYNATDASVTYEVYEEMMKDARTISVPGFPNWVEDFIFNHQMKLHDFYYDIDQVGFKHDPVKQKELIKLYEGKIDVLQKELNTLVGAEINVASPKQVAVLLYQDLNFPQRDGTGEDVLVSLMANTKKITPKMHHACELILDIRRLRKAKGTYFEAKPDYDGRMKTFYNPVGTETGRSSTSIMDPPVRPENIGLAFQTMTKHGDGVEVRSTCLADDGYVIVETDMSQAEARIVARFANDEAVLKLFALKADIHRLTASWIFGIKPEDIRTEERFIGKTIRHAGNYDMGKHRLMELVNTEAKKQNLNVNISEWKAGKHLDRFHEFSPNIRGVFHTTVQDKLQGDNRILINPFGRRRQFYDQWGRELFKEAYAQLPQSTVPDHLRRACWRARVQFLQDGVDSRYVLEAHDAIISLVRESDVASYVRIIHEEIERPIDFIHCSISRPPIVIPAETKIGRVYQECKDKKCPGCSLMHDYHLPIVRLVEAKL